MASNLTNTAALAIEYHLIGHFKRRSEGGTLFNEDRGHCPGRPGSENESLSYARKMAAPAVVPPGTKPLSKQLYARFIEYDNGTVGLWQQFPVQKPLLIEAAGLIEKHIAERDTASAA